MNRHLMGMCGGFKTKKKMLYGMFRKNISRTEEIDTHAKNT